MKVKSRQYHYTHTNDYDLYICYFLRRYILGFLKSSQVLSSYGGLLTKVNVLLLGDLLGTRTSVRSNTTQKMIGQNPEEIDGTEVIENLLEGRWRRGANTVSFPNYLL